VTLWEVLEEAERLQWDCVPFESVGPLRFGMRHNEAVAAVHGILVDHQGVWDLPRVGLSARLTDSRQKIFGRHAVNLYYTPIEEQLYCVAVNALYGPQVTLGRVPMVGRLPSVVEPEIVEAGDAEGTVPYFSPSGDLSVEGFGVTLRFQRAGDVILSRPVFIGRQWSERFWDNTESAIPEVEWRRGY